MQPYQAVAPALTVAQAQCSHSASLSDAELSMLDQPQPGVVELLVLRGEIGKSCDPTCLPSAGLAAWGWQLAVAPQQMLFSPFSCPHPGPGDEESSDP